VNLFAIAVGEENNDDFPCLSVMWLLLVDEGAR